ncbi:hypothetical protein ACFL53_03750 [Pseudomonadota bacterium]
MREVQTEPKIQITVEGFDFAVHIVRLNIKNIGFGPAKNLKFSNSVISGDESGKALLNDFTKSNFFNTGLRYFGPAQNIYSHYTQTNIDFEGKSKSILSFELTYESVTGKLYKEEILVDMSELKGMYQLGKPNLYAIAKSLENMQKDVHHLTTGFRKIKVDSYTAEDREREREEQLKQYEEYESQHCNS